MWNFDFRTLLPTYLNSVNMKVCTKFASQGFLVVGCRRTVGALSHLQSTLGDNFVAKDGFDARKARRDRLLMTR